MATITVSSNTVQVTVQGVTYSYQIQLSASPTTLPSTGGQVAITATVTNTTLNQPVSGASVVLNELNTVSSWSGTTNSSGVVVFNVNIPANNTSTPDTYSFQATATITTP